VDLAELEAREAIRDLVARYHQSGDAGRLAEMVALFCDEAVLELDGREVAGRGAIRSLFESAAGATRSREGAFVRHFTATHQIDVLDAGRARGRAYYAVLTEAGLDHWGRYLDEYRRESGAWRFARRRVTVDGRVPGGWAERARATWSGADSRRRA
jgi:ketosteroid isomerase-like protein